MQGPKGKQGQARRSGGRRQAGRVIDMKSFKAQKRIQNARGGRSWFHFLLSLVTATILVLSGVFAVLSCIPISIQLPSVLYCSFFAAIGCALSIWLYVIRDRFAIKFLSFGFICLVISIVAGAVRVY